MEEWRWIPDLEGEYEVSNEGRIRSWKRRGPGTSNPEPKILRVYETGDGYLRASYHQAGKVRKELVHRLVARAFIGEPPTRWHQAAHWDGNPKNNKLSNLRWATPQENTSDKFRHGTVRFGEQVPISVLSDIDTLVSRRLSELGIPNKEIAALFNCSTDVIRYAIYKRKST